jgi:ribosomal protein S18 acetylase RimI-like enzyme
LSLLVRLQASLNVLAASDREHVRVGPFDAYVDHVRSPKYYSFALPEPDSGAAELAAALPALREAYASRGRNARTEHIEALCPALEEVLLADGWVLSERMPVMVCTPDRFVRPPVPEGLNVQLLDGMSSEELVTGFLTAQRIAFKDESPITDEEIVRWRTRAATHFFVAGLLGDVIAGTALCSQIAQGVTEVGGVATPPEYRRRGIAASVTAAAVAAAFAAGAEVAWLTAAGASAQGIYARAGFGVEGTLLAYDAPAS